MNLFEPKAVYYEENILNYPFGREMLIKYQNKGLPCHIIEKHNNIEEMRAKQNYEFAKMKDYLILGIRKSMKYVPNCKTSDFLVPYTSSGCSAACLYCYLVCNYNKCSYLRVFVNREQMMEKLIKTANKADRDQTFEIGSNSDLVLENTVTGNLKWTIESFSNAKKGFITMPTKFHMIDDILNLDHKGKTIIRMSLNPEFIIKRVELKTSSLMQRIDAINKLCDSGYKVGILIAPVVLIDDYKTFYKELFETMRESLTENTLKNLFFEIIFMTYSYIHRKINEEAFPNAIELYSKDKMTGRGRGRYCYKKELRNEATDFMLSLCNKYFPSVKLEYIV